MTLYRDAAGTDIAGGVVGVGKVADDDADAIVRGVDKLTAADVHTDVRDGLRGGAAGLLEEHEVAGGKLVPRNGNAVLQLSGGGAVDGVAELCAGILHEARAVKADARAGAAVDVAVADILKRRVRKLLPPA